MSMSFDLGGRDQKVKSSKASKLSKRTGMMNHEHTQIRRRIGFLNLHKNSGACSRSLNSTSPHGRAYESVFKGGRFIASSRPSLLPSPGPPAFMGRSKISL